MKPCPYRKTHEFDTDGLCKHCYARFAEPQPPAEQLPLYGESQRVDVDGIPWWVKFAAGMVTEP